MMILAQIQAPGNAAYRAAVEGRYSTEEPARGVYPLCLYFVGRAWHGSYAEQAQWLTRVWRGMPADAPRCVQLFHAGESFLCPGVMNAALGRSKGPDTDRWVNQHITGQYESGHERTAIRYLADEVRAQDLPAPNIVHLPYEGPRCRAMAHDDPACWGVIEALCMAAERWGIKGFPIECIGEAGFGRLRAGMSDPAKYKSNPAALAFNQYVQRWEVLGMKSLLAPFGWTGAGTMVILEHAAKFARPVVSPRGLEYPTGWTTPDSVSHMSTYTSEPGWQAIYSDAMAALSGSCVIHLDAGMQPDGVMPNMTDIDWKAAMIARYRKRIKAVLLFLTPNERGTPGHSEAHEQHYQNILAALGSGRAE